MRIGFGYDVHRFAEERELWLGGIKIPHSMGLLGHSDADVVIHAMCDALLGAAALGDIGTHFPDNSEKFHNIDSKILLRKTVQLLQEHGFGIGNIDCTVAAQSPRLSPYIQEMRETLSHETGIPVNCISIKATTTEKLGFEGRQEGISAYAVALITEI